MIKVLELAIEKVKVLSEEEQRIAAELLEQVAAARSPRFYDLMSQAQRDELARSLAEAERGEIADEAELDRELDALLARRA